VTFICVLCTTLRTRISPSICYHTNDRCGGHKCGDTSARKIAVPDDFLCAGVTCTDAECCFEYTDVTEERKCPFAWHNDTDELCAAQSTGATANSRTAFCSKDACEFADCCISSVTCANGDLAALCTTDQYLPRDVGAPCLGATCNETDCCIPKGR
jgi:hypothetical protein